MPGIFQRLTIPIAAAAAVCRLVLFECRRLRDGMCLVSCALAHTPNSRKDCARVNPLVGRTYSISWEYLGINGHQISHVAHGLAGEGKLIIIG